MINSNIPKTLVHIYFINIILIYINQFLLFKSVYLDCNIYLYIYIYIYINIVKYI